ncbi:MAG: serine/threonine protein kinase [Planctomycetes bacterium]|nr:serine/threonine protein kinase [Planctomycetota bacterium]
MTSTDTDGNLAQAIEVEGYKVLPPCVIYGKIGQGGMGAVYRGRHLNLDIDVAVKCLKPELVGGDEQFVVRFRREARAAAQINHQNVIRVFDVAEDKGLHYLIMELVQGESARERVARKGRLAIGEALEIVFGAALGLAEAHRKGFVHRDIKPDNIMVSSSGQVKVADLGLAKPLIREDQASLLSGTNLVMGTPQYMPPEQWENTANVTAAADVWALGATLYYLLVGGEAIQKDSLPRVMQRILLEPFPDPRRPRPEVPADVAAVIAKATSTKVADRYQDAQALADAIEQLATRRESLRDKGAIPTSQVSNQVLSPPPAKTLAKIKFWLDQHGQGAAPPPASPAPGSGGTLVVDGAGQTLPMLPPRRSGPSPWVAAAAVVVAVLLVAWALAPGRPSGGVFAEADRLEGLGLYAAAVEETNAVHQRDPSLPANLRAERLARLHAAWARELGAAGNWPEALAKIERSLTLRDTPGGREQKAELMTRIRSLLDGKLVREAPGSRPVDRTTPVEFRGRLDDPLVQAVRLGGRVVERSGGAFAVAIDTGGRPTVDVEVTLANGETLALQPWPVVYVPEGGRAPAVELSITPEIVRLEDERSTELVVRTVAGAEVRIDGQVVAADADSVTHRWPVRSDAAEPPPLRVSVRLPGQQPVERTVPVQRVAPPLVFVRPPAFEGVRVHQGEAVARPGTLRLVGQVDAPPATLLVDGREVAADWTPQGGFAFALELPQPGLRRVRVTVQKRFRAPLEQELSVHLLAAPAFEFVAPTRDGEVTASSSYAVFVGVDRWATSVSARRDGVLLRQATPPSAGGTVRLEAGLIEGANALEITVANAVGLETSRRLTVTRVAGQGPVAPVDTTVPPGGKPRILQVVAVIDGAERPVEKGRTLFARSGATLRVDASDPDAAVLCRDKPIRPEDLVLQADSVLLKEPLRCELRVQTAAGMSEPFRFGILLDDAPPSLDIQKPSGPVGSGRPFACSGTYLDQYGIQGVTVNGLAAAGASDRPRGSWSIELPGIDAPTEVVVVVTDRAGNRVERTIRVEP